MVNNAIYWVLPSGYFSKKSACLAIVAGIRFVQRFLRQQFVTNVIKSAVF